MLSVPTQLGLKGRGHPQDATPQSEEQRAWNRRVSTPPVQAGRLGSVTNRRDRY
jgi:hypothetical protein